jgi:tetratricopeptide (TPR) repeat protein
VSSDREKIFQAAQKWVDKKRYDRAIEEYQKAIQLDPKDMRTLLKIGDLQTRMQGYEQAIATYDRVGQFYAEQGFALKAIAVYKQIRELIRKHTPQLTDRYAHIIPKLAEIYTQLGLTSDALAAWDEVAARHQRNNQDRDAIEVFRKMVGLDTTNPLPYLRLAEACCRVQALDEAIEAFWTAAELLLKLERRDDALKVIERILHFKQDPKYARVAAQLYLQKGKREDGLQALAKLQIAFQVDPRDLDTLALLAQAFTVIGQADKAIEVYKEMARIARDAERHELYQELVQHLMQVAPHDEGVRALLSVAPQTVPPEVSVETSSVQVDDSEVELLDEFEEEEEPAEAPSMPSHEAPFELQRSHRPEARPFQASSPDVVVVDSDVEVVQEYGDHGGFDAQAHVKKALVDAEAFRKLRLYSKAHETLHIALEIDPGSVEVREKLRDILIESGDRDGAIGESVTLAVMYLERGESERAEAMLYTVLETEPQHPAALEMLAQIQSGAAPEQRWTADGPTEAFAPDYEEPNIVEAEQSGGYELYRARGPLPSYDLEEISASSAMASPEMLEQPGTFEMDDPFAVSEPGVAEPLPSFPLGSEDDELLSDLDEPGRYAGAEAMGAPPAESFDEAPDTSSGAAPENATEAIEEALEEAEFFASRGLYDDAKTIVADQLARAPGHPLLLERMREIEHLIAASVESVTIDRSQLGRVVAAREETPQVEDRSFDIAASLEALDNLEPVAQPPPAASGIGDLDVEKVFQKFKEGIRAQVSENDSSTHYDLGVAYKEMGLLADAMNEFELAARDATRECMCFAMIGMIRLERGDLDLSAAAYKRALEAGQKTIDQEMSLYYELGVVYEMKSEFKEALYYFQKVARRDPQYRGVSDRIAALQPGSKSSASRAVNDDDDFDRVFDDLFDRK